jgi:hypothetical protein
LKLKYDELLLNGAFNLNPRLYIKGTFWGSIRIDFEAGCIKGFVEASGGNMCETEEDGQLKLFGDVLLACGDVEGSGTVSAVKNCGAAARGQPLYEMTVAVTTLNIKGASLTGSANLVGEVATDGMTEPADLIWYFTGEMLFAPGAAFAVQIPSLPDDAKLEANFRAVLQPGKFLPTIEAANVQTSFTYTSKFTAPAEPTVTAFVVLSASYPCDRGTSYHATAALTFNNLKDISNLADLKQLNMTASIFCKPLQGDPEATIAGAIAVLTIGKIKIIDITISLSVYKGLPGEGGGAGLKTGRYRFVATAEGTMERSSQDHIGQLGQVYNYPGRYNSSPLGEQYSAPDGTLGKVDAGNFEMKTKISIDSESKSISFMVNIEYETPNFNATLFVASTFGKCDAELGKAVQIAPMKPMLRPSGTKCLKLQCDELLSCFAFNFNLRRYNSALP